MRLLQQQQQQQQISGVDGVTGFKIPTHKVSSSSGMPYLEEIFSGREYDKDDNDDNGSVVDLTRDDGDDDDVNIKKNISCVQTSETDQEIRNMGRMFLRHDQQEQQQQQQLKHSATFQDYDDHSDGRDSVRVIYDSDDDAEFIEVPTTPATTAAVAVGSSHHQKSNNTGSEDDSPLFLDEEEAMMMLIQQQQLEEEEKIKTANGVASGEGRGASDGGAFQGMYVDDAEDISVIMAKFHQQEKQAKLSSSSSTLLLPVSPLKQHQQQLPPLPAPSNSTSSYNHQHQHQQVYPPPPLSTFKKSSSSNTLPPAKSILPTSSLPIDDLLLNYTLLAPPEFISNFSTITNNPSTTNSINNDTTANNNSQEKALHSSILRDVVYSWSHQQIQDEVMRVKRRLEKMPIGAPEEQMNGWIFWMGFLEEVGKVLPSSSSDWTRGTSGSPKTKMKVIPTTSITGSSSSITPSKRRISSLLQFEDDDEEEEEEEEEEATKEEVAADISGPPVKRARTEDLSPLSETTSSPLVRGLPGSGSSSPAPTLPGPTFTVAATKHPLDLQQQLQKQSSGRPLPVSSPIESDTWHLAVAASPTSANEVRAAAPKEDFIDKSATSLLSTKNSSSPTRAPTTPSPKQHQYLSDQQPQQQQRLIKIPESAVLFDQNEVILVQDDYEVVIDQNRVPFGRVNRNQPISLDELDDDNFQDNPNNQKKFIIDNIADHELDGAVDVPIVLDDENEEFERFFSSLTAATADNTAAQGGGSLSFAANAAAVRGNLENEERELKIQKRREERDAADVSGDMIREVQVNFVIKFKFASEVISYLRHH